MIGLAWHGGGTIPQERAGAITFKGNPMTLTGPEVSVGKRRLDSRRSPPICQRHETLDKWQFQLYSFVAVREH